MKSFLPQLTLALGMAALLPAAASAQLDLNSPLVGNWCAQGDVNRPESITAGGPLAVHFRNWMGATATGTVAPGSRSVVVAKWKGIHGALSGDNQTINWSNGTFWKRCTATVKH
jgi:hypothetical protein